MARADPAACPGRGYKQDQPAVHRDQNGGEPAPRVNGMRQSDEQSGRLRNRTKRARIGKQAVPRTAPSARTLSAICP